VRGYGGGMDHRLRVRAATIVVGLICAAALVTGCSAAPTPAPPTPAVRSSSQGDSPARSASTIPPAHAASHAPPGVIRSTTHGQTSARPTRTAVQPASRPVIVIDPGHSPAIQGIDPVTGLNVSGYENEPEMRDVFAVAELVKAQLQAAGYRVIMTKATVDTPVLLNQIAATANNAHAALALSIHDQAGNNGGIGFNQGNNIVYVQSVGDYRVAGNGQKTVFTDRNVAALSQKYGQIFRAQRAKAESHAVTLQGDVGYDLGSRGLDSGNIWMVQLLARVPWIYNEAGGNSAGLTGLSEADKAKYADGLIASVEACIPLPQ
jgi:N-acetylmuramoyl-L-alanine amidase